MMCFSFANQRTNIQRWREQHPCASVLTCASFLVTAGGLLLAGIIAPINNATRIGLASAGAFLAISTLAIEVFTEGPARVLNDGTDLRRASLLPGPDSAERHMDKDSMNNTNDTTSLAFLTRHTTRDQNRSDGSLLNDNFERDSNDSGDSEPRP
jgi:hypothetical protein